jgi:hypothetical protein
MSELPYPWTKISGAFPSESSVEVRVAVIHGSDPVEDQAVIDSIKQAITDAGASAVTATEYSVASVSV